MSELVPEGWIQKNLGEFVERFYQGINTVADKVEYEKSGVPIIQTKHITSGVISTIGAKFIGEADYIKYRDKFNPRINDILLSNIGTIGKTVLIKSEKQFLIAWNLFLISVSEKMNPIFLNFCFKRLDDLNFYENLMTGNATKFVNKSNLAAIPILTPPLPEQEKIAAILTSVDEVIEKSQAQIDKLQDLKKATMNQLLTRGINHTEFKDTPLGKIPKNWEVKKLGEVGSLERGKFSHRPRNDPQFYGGDIPFLQTGDVPKRSPFITEFSQTLNDKGLGVSKEFPIGTLVITIAATIGEIAMLKFRSCFPDSLVGIIVDPTKADNLFIMYVMRYLKGELESLAPQTAQKNINLDILNPFLVPFPPLDEQQRISSIFSSIDLNIEEKQRKLEQTKALKKSLMQDLLTGKKRVKVG